MTQLPGVLAEIAEIAGEDAALAIAAERGGTNVYIPPRPREDHWLSKAIGHEAALAVAAGLTCGIGLRVDVPFGPTSLIARARAVVDRMIGEGASETQIARVTGYSTRAVRRRRALLKASASTIPSPSSASSHESLIHG